MKIKNPNQMKICTNTVQNYCVLSIPKMLLLLCIVHSAQYWPNHYIIKLFYIVNFFFSYRINCNLYLIRVFALICFALCCSYLMPIGRFDSILSFFYAFVCIVWSVCVYARYNSLFSLMFHSSFSFRQSYVYLYWC